MICVSLMYTYTYFLQFKSEFCNKEFMIWATVSFQSCFGWLSTAFHLWCKEYNQSDFSIDHLVTFMCRVISCVVGRGCLLWPLCSVIKTLLAFALLHFVLQGQIFHLTLKAGHCSILWPLWPGPLFLFLPLKNTKQNRETLQLSHRFLVSSNTPFSVFKILLNWTYGWNWKLRILI